MAKETLQYKTAFSLFLRALLDYFRRPKPALPEMLKDQSTLLVGEGNFSFGLSLLNGYSLSPFLFMATSFKNRKNLSADSLKNISRLQSMGCRVELGVDATRLGAHLPNEKFSQIIFQFPHTASRLPKWGKTKNHFLVRNFFKSCLSHLSQDGKVFITVVDTPFYFGSFQFFTAAKKAGFSVLSIHPFRFSAFPGYTHENTQGGSSALSTKTKYCTWVFEVLDDKAGRSAPAPHFWPLILPRFHQS